MLSSVQAISLNELRSNSAIRYHKIFESETVRRFDFPLYESDRTLVPFQESFVVEIPECTIVSENGYIVTRDNHVLVESYRDWYNYTDHPLFNEGSSYRLIVVDSRVAVITAPASVSFAHWMFDILPRIKLLAESKLEFDFLCVPQLRLPFQIATLKSVGIEPGRLIEMTDESCVMASKVLLPSLIGGQFTVRPKWVCDFLRDVFLPPQPAGIIGRIRIYIARKTSTTPSYRRYVVNETDVLTYLEAHGFRRYVLEDMAVPEQARLFGTAEAIVAAHGSALTNLVFCRPGTKVAEVFMPHHLDESFYEIGKQMQLQHHCILSDTEQLTGEQRDAGDIYIPINRLREVFALH